MISQAGGRSKAVQNRFVIGAFLFIRVHARFPLLYAEDAGRRA